MKSGPTTEGSPIPGHPSPLGEAGNTGSEVHTPHGLADPLNSELAQLVNALDRDAREFYEERAGILEFEAGYSRDKAEQKAWLETQHYLMHRTD